MEKIISDPVPILKIKLPKVLTSLFYSINNEELAYSIIKRDLKINPKRYIVIKSISDEYEEDEIDVLLVFNVFFDKGKIIRIDDSSNWGIVGIFELDFNLGINIEKMLEDSRED